MSYEQQVIDNQKAIQKILSDAKEIPELDNALSVITDSDLIPVYSVSESKAVKSPLLSIIQMVAQSLGYYASTKVDIIFKANQTVFNISSRPHSIDLYKRGQWQIEKNNYDYSYDNLTGNITIFNSNSVDTNYSFRGFGKFSTKQEITVGADNQVTYNFSGSPANIELYYEGQIINRDDYTRTTFSEGNSFTITNPELISIIRAGKIFEVRKF